MLRSEQNNDIPELTKLVAGTTFPKGSVIITVRDELGPIFDDELFAKLDRTIDPTKPSRLTEIKVIIRPGMNEWVQENFSLGLGVYSINAYSLGGGSFISFRIRNRPALITASPTTTTLPSVVGQRLNTALRTLWGLGLKNIFNLGPVAMSADPNVDSQSPNAGTVVQLPDSVYLSISLAVAQTGVKQIAVSNNSNRTKSLDLWLYDYSTGNWNNKGSVAYKGQANVDLIDGPIHALAAGDPILLNCRNGRPEDSDCVYQTTQGSYVGDSNGLVVPWPITQA
jgi:hypothetical protein